MDFSEGEQMALVSFFLGLLISFLLRFILCGSLLELDSVCELQGAWTSRYYIIGC